MRGKEDAHDYRYFRDPDLVTIRVTSDTVAKLKAQMPEDPRTRLKRFESEYGLPEDDARMLIEHRRIADYFEKASAGIKNTRAVANCITGPIFARLGSEAAKDDFKVNVSPENLNALIKLLDSGKIRMNLVKSTLEKMLDTGKSASEFLNEKDLAGIDAETLQKICKQAVQDNPNAVKDYRNGKTKALKAVLGAVMKATRGRANPLETEAILSEIMKKAD